MTRKHVAMFLTAAATLVVASTVASTTLYAPAMNTRGGLDSLLNLAQWEDGRVTGDGKLFDYLKSNSPLIRLRAVEVIGRLQDRSDAERLLPMLGDHDDRVASEACFALGQIGSELAVAALKDFTKGASTQRISLACEALGKIGGTAAVEILMELLRDFNGAVRAAAAMALARAADPASGNALLLSIHDPDLTASAAAIYALGFVETPRTGKAVAPFLQNENAYVRAMAARTLGTQKKRDGADDLILLLRDKDPGVVIHAAHALGKMEYERAARPLGQLLLSHPSHQIRAAAAQALGEIGGKSGRDDLIRALQDPSPFVRISAVTALPAVLGTHAAMFASAMMDDNSRLVRAAAIRAVGASEAKERVEELRRLAERDGDAMMRAAAIKGLSSYDRDDVRAFLRTRLEDKDWVVVTETVTAIGAVNDRAAAADLMAVYEARKARVEVNIRIEALKVLAGFKALEAEAMARAATEHEDARIRTEAFALLEAIGATAPEKKPDRVYREMYYDRSRRRNLSPPLGLRHATLTTSSGPVELELFGDDAAQIVASFIKLVSEGSYDNLIFHRVVQDYVVQGGDPRGDGWGDAGYFVRSEFNRHRHETGSVGIAHDGKDTGGCQFFINLSPQHKLDGRYTVFGRVTRGMDVVNRIDIGDAMTIRMTD